MPLESFHPVVRAWFEQNFPAPTQPQAEAWPSIKAGRHTLIAAPTGSGKTLAAFLAAIDDLVRQALNDTLADQTQIVYVSPLKALSNDIHRNLEIPLAGIRAELALHGFAEPAIRAMVRTGDTPQAERERMRRQPPHILVTTPESLYLLLTSESGRRLLATARTLIVDEIHALAGNKRGAHLALSVERLQALCERPLVRIGLSATQKPIDLVAHFLTGAADRPCTIVDRGHERHRDLAIEVPGSPLEAVMASEVWQEVYDRLAELVGEHRTTLIFVNTRRLAERLAKHLAERVGETLVTSHHGSLARGHRLEAEQRLKRGELRALVATASLELGIDIGDIDLVCQIGSPRAINTLLQRVGRSGHAVGGTPRGRLFPLSRDDLVECVALLAAVRRGELDRLAIPPRPRDVLAQQIVAEVSAREWGEDALFELIRRAWPYRELAREEFDALLGMLAEGFSTRRGRRALWLHRDAVNKRLRGRRGARLTALTNAGAIPDQFDYEVILQPEGCFIGTLNEDFAFESLPGDIFQLGNTAYRVLKVEQGKVHVEDAHGQPPNIPFWFGEAPGRSDELSLAVSRLHAALEERLIGGGPERAIEWAVTALGVPGQAAVQLVEYLAAAHAALGALPSADTVIFERFFDEAGDQHLVIHAPFGSRVNRAWGLALRKRFCRKFNFELQAAALEDSIVLSLGATHSFPLAEVAAYLNSGSARELLVQALLDAPMFATRWRWSASIALALPRNRNGQRVPAQFQRMNAEDLLAVIFPDQLACLENIAGKREIPDHPLVQQTLDDCLHEAMDIDGLERLLARIESGRVRILARDLAGPSPLAHEILGARPYAFLDDAPAEERRTQMVQARRFLDPKDAAELGRLDPQAIARVRAEAWPEAVDPDELHDALVLLGFVTIAEGTQTCTSAWPGFLDELAGEHRATVLRPGEAGSSLWVAAERLALLQAVFPGAALEPPIDAAGPAAATPWTREQALVELIRARLEGLGPVSAHVLAAPLGLSTAECDAALMALESEGFAMRGHFTPGAETTEWCERGLLARIHRYTVKRLRQEIRPVSSACFMRFLLQWQGLIVAEPGARGEGPETLAAVLEQLEGFQAPAAAWEAELLPARLQTYRSVWLDTLCAAGRFLWTRLSPSSGGKRPEPDARSRGAGPVRSTPIALVSRRGLPHWRSRHAPPAAEPRLSSTARRVLEQLDRQGASFFDELTEASGLLRSQAEQALAELAALGLVGSDSFAGLRALLLPAERRKRLAGHRHHRGAAAGVEDAGRWSRLRAPQPEAPPPAGRWGGTAPETSDYIAHALLRRYGVVFRRLLERETGLPPWRELLYVFRRMEARGDVRGGRFVEGFSGEQYALPEAVGLLRDVRRQERGGELVAMSAADPLNLVGIVLPGNRVPALTSNRILFRDGAAVALLIGGDLRALEPMDEKQEWEIRKALLRRRMTVCASSDRQRPAPASVIPDLDLPRIP